MTLRDDPSAPQRDQDLLASTSEELARFDRELRDLRELAARLLLDRDADRRRIALVLHNTAGQNLAAAGLNLAMLQRLATTSDAAALLDECVALNNRSARQLRALSYELHPPALDDFGLESAIREYAEGLERSSSLKITIDADAPLHRATPEVELALFRVVQESLVNVLRHSGSATATVRLVTTPAALSLEIQDAGHRVHDRAPECGAGLWGARERIRHLGGSFDVEFGPTGTCVRVIVPTAEAGP